MNRLAFLFAMTAIAVVAACGGHGPKPAEPGERTVENTGPEREPAEVPVPEVTGPVLPFGAGTLSLLEGDRIVATIALDEDGILRASNPEVPGVVVGRLSHSGELSIQGEVKAKINRDGSVTVLNVERELVDGKLASEKRKWEVVGVIDEDGAFRGTGPGVRLAIDEGGGLVGLPGRYAVSSSARGPEMRKVVLFLVVSLLTGGTSTTEVETPVGAPVVAP